jgi:8-oxo-dGTP pyrophosphatase MutT (NUDIX family)
MIHLQKPDGFVPQLEAVGCFVHFDESILLLLRSATAFPGPHKWCFPGGKMENGETPPIAMARELFEETGIVAAPEQLEKIATVSVENELRFLYHMFRLRLLSAPHIVLSKEHQGFVLLWPWSALSYDLMPDSDACIKLVYGRKYPFMLEV